YWVDVLVAGAPARVMLQLFERRTLTYNPANPPQWQVEMANVGRAYYDWRYGGTAPEPAISAEVLPDGVQLRGWNWPPNVEVSARIELGGAETPLVGPLSLQSDASGRFGALAPMNTEVEGALLAGANLRIVAYVGDRQTALPLAVELPSGSPAVEGMLTGVVPTQAGYLLLVRDHAGREWHVDASFEAVLSYSEGEETQDATLATGDHVRVEGRILGGKIRARSLRLMSVSRTGARLGYDFEAGGGLIRASGTNWPASGNIAFSVRPFAGEGGVQLGTARADSRGNVAASFPVPPAPQADRPLWLFAQVVEQNSLMAQVAVLYRPAWEANGPLGLILTADSGEQMGGPGGYCHVGQCAELLGVPVPRAALPVREGNVLGLRSQVGPNLDLGITPQRFTAQLYAYPPEPANEGASIGGTFYFSPKSLPVFSTGEVPGRPFSVSLPSDLPPGKYLLIAAVVWSEGPGPREDATYGFALEVPPFPRPIPR
ncbi:MAG TPA: hypothetical protein VFH60_09005, partial [Chloroflexia bacterium]|nr:hypothetical protein [Chloroflexia bacterium]